MDLLCDALSVWGCEDAELGRVSKRIWQVVEQGGDSLCDADGSENARAEERVATETVVERVFGAWDVRVDPGHVGQLLESKSTDGTLVTFPHPFQGQVIAGRVEREWRGKGIKTAFGKSPQESVGFQVKGARLRSASDQVLDHHAM